MKDKRNLLETICSITVVLIVLIMIVSTLLTPNSGPVKSYPDPYDVADGYVTLDSTHSTIK